MWSLELFDKGKRTESFPLAESAPLARLREDLERLVEQFTETGPWGAEITWHENEREFLLRVVAPGFEIEDFDVQVSGQQLVIKAEHKQETATGEGHPWRVGRLFRSLPLPAGVNTDGIQANYRSGVLALRLPKAVDAGAKRIEVKST